MAAGVAALACSCRGCAGGVVGCCAGRRGGRDSQASVPGDGGAVDQEGGRAVQALLAPAGGR